MPNTALTIDMITQEALMILHQKLNFVTNICTEYDSMYAKEGAKIGNTARIRLPIQHTVGSGPVMDTGAGADTLENQVTLTLDTQRHVPMRFTSNEKTMHIDDFAKRHLEPAMSKLAAMIEADAFSMISEVANQVSAGDTLSYADILAARVLMGQELSPEDQRCALLDLQGNADLINELKGLFNSQKEISHQYKKGTMGNTADFDFYENTLLPNHTSGAEGGGSNYLVNGANQVGTFVTPNEMSLIVDTGVLTVKRGDVFTMPGVFAVHPETKANIGELRQFAVLADFNGAGTISVSPALIVTGPYQNCSASPADNAPLTFVGEASTAYKQSLLFQKGFACFATADLVIPPNQQVSRQNFEGISMRIIEDSFDVVNDRLYTRVDVLYGFKMLRPGLACKLLHT
ncbi:MAG: hypothetical protein L3J21_09890 [Devosiaceae bacterium]|nr:hypothetical protein [Devosiaceae bacterium]